MIELYVPPAETTVSRRIVEPERAVFPRVTKEGLPVEEAEPEAGEEEILLPPPKEIAEVDREAVQAMLDEADQVLKGANREAEEILKGARRAAEAETAQVIRPAMRRPEKRPRASAGWNMSSVCRCLKRT